jgi:hypothetical protein
MERSNPLSDIVGALAGVAFALLFFVSLAVIDPLREATNQELLDWWSDGGNRDNLRISMYTMLLAGPLFLVFLTRLRARLQAAEQGSGWTALVFAAGIVFVATLGIRAVFRGVIVQAVEFRGEPAPAGGVSIPGPELLRYVAAVADASMGLVVIPFATLVVVAASALVLKTRPFGRWVGWLGLVVGALSLVLIALLMGPWASPLILIWVLAASFELVRTRGARAVGVESPHGEVRGHPGAHIPVTG